MFFGKRDRLMKGAWRHGVVGIENVTIENENIDQQSVFYKDTLQKKLQDHQQREAINLRR